MDICTICQSNIEEDKWVLKCNHPYHGRCISRLYKINKNYFDFETRTELKPECCLCRKRIHKVDLPPKNPGDSRPRELTPWEQRLMNEPARAQMGMDAPVRMVRALKVIRKEDVRRRLDKLIERRNVILERQRLLQRPSLTTSSPRPGTSSQFDPTLSNKDVAKQKKRRVIFDDSSEEEIDEREVDMSIDNYPAYDPPTTEYLNRPFVAYSNQEPESPIHAAQVLQDSADQMQELAMEIGVMSIQYNNMDESIRVGEEEDFVLDDNRSEASHDEDYWNQLVNAEKIIGHWGRGRNIYYVIQWDDGDKTLGKYKYFDPDMSDLVKDYQRHIRKINTRNCRARQREAREQESRSMMRADNNNL